MERWSDSRCRPRPGFGESAGAQCALPGEPAVKSVEIDADKDFPDLDRSNQVWPR